MDGFVHIRNRDARGVHDFERIESYFALPLLAVHDAGKYRTVIFLDGNACNTEMSLAEIGKAVAEAKSLQDFGADESPKEFMDKA